MHTLIADPVLRLSGEFELISNPDSVLFTPEAQAVLMRETGGGTAGAANGIWGDVKMIVTTMDGIAGTITEETLGVVRGTAMWTRRTVDLDISLLAARPSFAGSSLRH